MGARVVIAVDVGSAEEMNLYNYGDRLNGWWAALRYYFGAPKTNIEMPGIKGPSIRGVLMMDVYLITRRFR